MPGRIDRSLVIVALALGLWGTENVVAQQPNGPGVVVNVATDRPDAIYKIGEKATFLITVTEAGTPVSTGEVAVKLTRDLAVAVDEQKLPLGKDPVKITGTMTEPGFLYCEASITRDGKSARGLASAGFDPLSIKPACSIPEDFDAFWQAGRAELAKIPIDVQLTPLPNYSDDQQNSFKISFANLEGTRLYGFLSVPKGRKPPYPVQVRVPWASWVAVTKPSPWPAQAGALYLDMSIHDFDMTAAPADVEKRPAYAFAGGPEREKYYFRRVILGLDRALDYIASRPDFDGKHMVVTGSSQGGGLSLILAGFNSHVTAAFANMPALCDQKAELIHRHGTWPNLLRWGNAGNPKWVAMTEYFDAVSFARKIKCPTLVTVGFIDETCQASAVYGAYNVIGAPKYIFNAVHSTHTAPIPEMAGFDQKWIQGQLGLTPEAPFPGAKK